MWLFDPNGELFVRCASGSLDGFVVGAFTRDGPPWSLSKNEDIARHLDRKPNSPDEGGIQNERKEKKKKRGCKNGVDS